MVPPRTISGTPFCVQLFLLLLLLPSFGFGDMSTVLLALVENCFDFKGKQQKHELVKNGGDMIRVIDFMIGSTR